MRNLLAITILAGATFLPAQVIQIPAMTQPSSVIDMDAVGPAGPTTLQALIAAGTNGGAPLSGVTLIPNTAAVGLYNTNITLGQALGYDAVNNQLLLVAPQGTFDAFDAQIDLAIPSTEFGIAIGDWVSTMVIEFRDSTGVVGTITTSSYTSANAKFFQSVLPFDQVFVRASSTGGNWVIPELHIQNGFGGTLATNTSIGAGCGGLSLAGSTRPVIGTSWNLSLTGIPATGTIGVEITGLSDPGINDLTALGLPGCGLRASLELLNVFLVGGASYGSSLPLPFDPSLVGVHLFKTAAVFENPPSNAFGAITANGIDGLIGDF